MAKPNTAVPSRAKRWVRQQEDKVHAELERWAREMMAATPPERWQEELRRLLNKWAAQGVTFTPQGVRDLRNWMAEKQKIAQRPVPDIPGAHAFHLKRRLTVEDKAVMEFVRREEEAEKRRKEAVRREKLEAEISAVDAQVESSLQQALDSLLQRAAREESSPNRPLMEPDLEHREVIVELEKNAKRLGLKRLSRQEATAIADWLTSVAPGGRRSKIPTIKGFPLAVQTKGFAFTWNREGEIVVYERPLIHPAPGRVAQALDLPQDREWTFYLPESEKRSPTQEEWAVINQLFGRPMQPSPVFGRMAAVTDENSRFMASVGAILSRRAEILLEAERMRMQGASDWQVIKFLMISSVTRRIAGLLDRLAGSTAGSRPSKQLAARKKPSRIKIKKTARRAPLKPKFDYWKKRGGKITYHKDGSATYTDWEGNSVTYNAQGYPDFRRYVHPDKGTVTIRQTGNRYKDALEADRVRGKAKPDRWTWHHHEDGRTMELIPAWLSRRFSHTGGVSLSK